MEIIRGKSTKVVHSQEVVSKDGGDTITHRVVFRINNEKASFESDALPRISENDEVCVAGRRELGVFTAYAYKNFTNGAAGEYLAGVNLPVILLGAVAVTAAAAVALATLPETGIIAMVVGLIFVVDGLYILNRMTRTSKASKLIASVSRNKTHP